MKPNTSPLKGALGNLDAFREVFFAETQEHLAAVEAILLRLDTSCPSHEDLNAIFRAVHSIKGSAAMLGCDDIAALTHLQESLLDLLRKGERSLEAGDVDAMLKAGDTLRSQVLRHRGLLDSTPDSTPVQTLLRQRVALPASDTPGSIAGAVMRSFKVRLAPLAGAIDAGELDMMLQGLAEMGELDGVAIDNTPGGSVSFEVSLQGAVADLESVLSLVVAPEQISIETVLNGSHSNHVNGDGHLDAGMQLPPVRSAPVYEADEFFVDPAEFKRRGHAPRPAAKQQAAVPPASVASVAEAAASRAAEPQPGAAASDASFIRVATEKIDLLVNLVGELVITEAMLAREGMAGEAGAGAGEAANSGLADLCRHTRNLQEAVLAIRMLPISNVLSRFPRMVRELSARLGKRVELKISGEGTELDRGLIEKISDPLTHLVRNAIDHGLETPQERTAAGKPAVGVVSLRASQRGGNIVIEVSDDGRGLDREKILARAAERGMRIAPDAPASEVWQLVFEAGFSTASEVTELSGRGVGMDVVKRNIQSLGGTIELLSAPGEGVKVTVSVPLTLAIMEAMTVAVGRQTYVLPLSCVVESRSVEAGDIHSLPGQGNTLRVRDDYLPVLHLAELFPPPEPSPEGGGIAVIVEIDGCNAALIVDDLVGQQQVVVKSLEKNFRRVPGLSGATVMNDGSVALILDAGHLLRLSGREGALLL
jgi:two-component system, chemotaxis family, sensor kinase CheA